MLANADPLTGWAIQPATEEVRKRAVLERGLRPYFHGGGNSAFCIDVKWVDPRKEALVVKTGKEEERLYEKNGKPLEVEWTQDGTIEVRFLFLVLLRSDSSSELTICFLLLVCSSSSGAPTSDSVYSRITCTIWDSSHTDTPPPSQARTRDTTKFQ